MLSGHKKLWSVSTQEAWVTMSMQNVFLLNTIPVSQTSYTYIQFHSLVMQVSGMTFLVCMKFLLPHISSS